MHRFPPSVTAGLILAAGLLLSAQDATENKPGPETAFRDGTQAAGLGSFTLVSGSPEKNYLLEGMSGGVCLLDYDRDGHLDIYFVNGGTIEAFQNGEHSGLQNALFRNQGDRTFVNTTVAAGVEGNGAWGFGCSVADYDNDGWPDLYITSFGSNILYRNQGNGRFEDVTAAAHIDDTRWSAGSAWADYDGDGWADVFVANYITLDPANLPEPGSEEYGSMGSSRGCQYDGLPVMCGPLGLPGAGDTLFHNNGDGTFTDVSRAAGVHDPDKYFGLGAVWCDFDNDGRVDLYVANDSKPNYLYRNQGDGTFEETGFLSGVAVNGHGQEQGGMGVDCGDYENRGRLAVFVTNFAEETNALYRNDGQMNFVDATFQTGLGLASLPYVGWGAFFFDYDNDGWLDLFLTNGHVYPQIETLPGSKMYRQRSLLFHNQGNGQFEEVAGNNFGVPPAVSRGAVRGDLDNDGALDIIVTNLGEPPTLLWNQVTPRQNYLTVLLQGSVSTRDAIGARVRIRLGSQWQMREVRRGGSYLCDHDPRIHFGLGGSTQVDEIEIRWPSGKITTRTSIRANQLLTLTEPDDNSNGSPPA